MIPAMDDNDAAGNKRTVMFLFYLGLGAVLVAIVAGMFNR